MSRPLLTEQQIREAAAANVRRWRDHGWALPEHRADHAAAILLPARDLLHPPDQPATAA